MNQEWQYFADFHTHTTHSDGKGSVLQNAVAAKNAGLQMVGITEHGGGSIGLGVKNHKWPQIREQVKQAESLSGISVLFGCEANVTSLDGSLDVPRKVRQSMDIVLAGLHPLVFPKTISDGMRLLANNMLLSKVSSRARSRARIDNTKAIVEAVYKNDVDIVSHPGLKLDIDTKELARACANRDTALEISAGHPYMTRGFVEIAKKQGARFAIGSDAHTPAKVGQLKPAEQVARLGGLAPRDIINVVEVGEPESTKMRHWKADFSPTLKKRGRRG